MLFLSGESAKLHALPPQLPDRPEAIAYLDQALFAHPAPAFAGRPEGVYLSDGLSPYEEAALMTREVRWLLAQGVDPERVAVFYPDGGGYAFAVTAALEDSGIPFYTDQQLSAASHGLAQFWLAALRAMAGGWRNRDMLCLIKSGYAPLTFEEGYELENYAYCYGVDRARWTRPFTRGPEATRAEALRVRLMELLLRARPHWSLRAMPRPR